MQLTMEFNDQFGMVCIAAEGVEMRIIETEENWNRYFVASSTGLRKSFSGSWDFENSSGGSDIEIYLFKVAYDFLELKRTRLEKPQDVSNEDYPQIG